MNSRNEDPDLQSILQNKFAKSAETEKKLYEAEFSELKKIVVDTIKNAAPGNAIHIDVKKYHHKTLDNITSFLKNNGFYEDYMAAFFMQEGMLIIQLAKKIEENKLLSIGRSPFGVFMLVRPVTPEMKAIQERKASLQRHKDVMSQLESDWYHKKIDFKTYIEKYLDNLPKSESLDRSISVTDFTEKEQQEMLKDLRSMGYPAEIIKDSNDGFARDYYRLDFTAQGRNPENYEDVSTVQGCKMQ